MRQRVNTSVSSIRPEISKILSRCAISTYAESGISSCSSGPSEHDSYPDIGGVNNDVSCIMSQHLYQENDHASLPFRYGLGLSAPASSQPRLLHSSRREHNDVFQSLAACRSQLNQDAGTASHIAAKGVRRKREKYIRKATTRRLDFPRKPGQ
jgi:hypothetical protein